MATCRASGTAADAHQHLEWSAGLASAPSARSNVGVGEAATAA